MLKSYFVATQILPRDNLDMVGVVGSSPIAPTNFSNPTEYEYGTHSQSGFCELGLSEAENIYIPRNEA